MLPDALLAQASALAAEDMKTLSAKAPSHRHGHTKERDARFQGEASANVAGVSVASGDRMDVTDTVSMLTDTVSESIGESGEGDRESLPQRKRDREQDEVDPITQPPEEEGRQLRRRQSHVNYAEPSLHQKLRQGDAHTFNSGEKLSTPGVAFFADLHLSPDQVLSDAAVPVHDIVSILASRLRYRDQEEDAEGRLHYRT
jgi:hypothetical protein